ncbi:MAG TPA: polysaccharide biosynthesis tyrosine autokinase [Bryobacteraceae bacterium]|jgi:succinoglycan biosynthesis transport protein ExoP|nr:polysaccharide biosynthesis tyrosine autokinase [Bryobacteraceae bacterium]
MKFPESNPRLLPAGASPLLRMPEPRPLAPVPVFTGPPVNEAGSSLLHLVELINRHKWKMLAMILVLTAAAGFVSFKMQPLYESTSIVRIDRHSSVGLIGLESGQTMPVNDMDQIMATQLEIIQSDPVLRPVADKYNLLERENQFKGLSPAKIAEKKSSPVFLRRLKVMRPPNTYLLRITYRASDPKVAADVANAIALSYIQHAFDSKDHAYEQVSDTIKRELGTLKARMDSSTARLAQYEKELNMVDPEQGSTIQTARLKQLNEEFTKAQTDRLRKESIVKVLQGTDAVAAAEAAGHGDTLDRALERLNAAQQQFAAVRAIYGDNYSEYRKAKEQVDELERHVRELTTTAEDRAKVEYQQALGQEQRLGAVVHTTKTEVDGLSARALQYEQLKHDADNDRKLYEDLERRTAEADINNEFQDAIIQIASPALPADRKVFPNVPLNLAIAFVLSGILSVIWVVLADAVDVTLSDPEDVAKRLDVQVLGVIPATRNLGGPVALARDENPSKRNAEAVERFQESIRGLRTSIGLANLDRPVRSLLVTSAQPSEGKSTTAANLALSFAQVGKRVLLVDADLRAPTVHKHFDIGTSTGLSDVLGGHVGWQEVMTRIDPWELYVVPAGPVSRRAVDMFVQAASQLFDQVCREFDIVIVDAPPLLGFAESHLLASMADSVIVVTKAETTSGKTVSKALDALTRDRANIMGLVMTQVKSACLKAYGDYGYGYAYGYGKKSRARNERTVEAIVVDKSN